MEHRHVASGGKLVRDELADAIMRLWFHDVGMRRTTAFLQDIGALLILAILAIGWFNLREVMSVNFEVYFTRSGARVSNSVAAISPPAVAPSDVVAQTSISSQHQTACQFSTTTPSILLPPTACDAPQDGQLVAEWYPSPAVDVHR